MDIKNVLILGGGTMGQKISIQCAMYGFNVVIYDINDEILANTKKIVEKTASRYQKTGVIKDASIDSIIARISYTSNLEEAAKNADLVNESVPEDPGLKAKIFNQLHTLCPAHTIFTTNTSTLLPSMFADKTGRPERFLALHYHNPGSDRIVDVMPHPGTAPEMVEIVEKFSRDTGMIPIVLKKENIGYVFNSMFSALLASALTLAANEVTSVEDIDKAWMDMMHSFIGPFGIIDSVGIETVYKITDYWAQKTKDKQNLKNAAFLKKYVERNELGIKTGKGFYSYPNPAYATPGFVESIGK
ncbi:3-hydroxyacyl-CoA dehydrogenase [Desulforegula conservatrix]|uniref:3-hydroxyacyl-CoA dehydrogenase n=1 Tax=Desulforegula conservatrix TaxID=153026 RepID=UPI00040E507A|nr:3-hydroxyacyl-CoA dehydrogenase [Desulforegula conservatrix]